MEEVNMAKSPQEPKLLQQINRLFQLTETLCSFSNRQQSRLDNALGNEPKGDKESEEGPTPASLMERMERDINCLQTVVNKIETNTERLESLI